MQYEIKYRFQGVIGTYYMSLVSEHKLSKQDIYYSAYMAVAKFLGANHFEIITVHKCV